MHLHIYSRISTRDFSVFFCEKCLDLIGKVKNVDVYTKKYVFDDISSKSDRLSSKLSLFQL